MLLGAVLVTCLLLVVNRLLARACYDFVVPARFDFDRLRTIVQFLLMFGLLIPQWWLIDRAVVALRAFLQAPNSE